MSARTESLKIGSLLSPDSGQATNQDTKSRPMSEHLRGILAFLAKVFEVERVPEGYGDYYDSYELRVKENQAFFDKIGLKK